MASLRFLLPGHPSVQLVRATAGGETALAQSQFAKQIPPLFIINAIDDRTTPVGPCVDFYQLLLKAGAHAELHLYNKGGHGFDIGEGHGESVSLWKQNFVAWLKDQGLL